jgi:collagenase-like PrtC family protease
VRILLQVHSLDQIKTFQDPLVDYVLRDPFFSYKHPSLQTKEDFLEILENTLLSHHKTYIEINGFIEESDLIELENWIKELLTYPIQGFYFADLAVLMILKSLNYQGETIYSPETILTNTLEIKTLLALVDRLVISKELTLEEIVKISKTFPQRIEMFGAGHLQMSVSRRPLLSSYLQEIGLSKEVINKTDYRIRELKRKEMMPILEESKTFCVFTQDILNPLEELPVLNQSEIYGIQLDDLFIDKDDAQTFFQLIIDQVKVSDLGKIESFYTINKLPLFKGYFERKTNLRQESV